MSGNSRAARYVNFVLGVWLILSAFLWPHGAPQRTNTWIVGLLCVAFAIAALFEVRARYLNTALAVWLFISCWALPTLNQATLWNNTLVAIAIFFISLVPVEARFRARGEGP